jgi:hypothetical protein
MWIAPQFESGRALTVGSARVCFSAEAGSCT